MQSFLPNFFKKKQKLNAFWNQSRSQAVCGLIIYGMLMTAEQNARAYFLQCGNSIVQHKNPDEATAEILYMFFNRRSCVDEPFASRVNRVIVDAMAAKGKVIGVDPIPHIRMANFIAPRGLDLTHNNYFIMDGRYFCILYVLV